MTNSRATWWRGVVRDHSGLLVLLAMCGVLSLTTIEVQHPTDADAGRTVVRQLLQERPEPTVFIAAD